MCNSKEYVDKVHERIHEIIDRLWMHYDDTDCEALVEAMERNMKQRDILFED